MGLFSKKVTREIWANSPAFGDPVNNFVKRGSKEFSNMHREMLSKLVSNKAMKKTNKDNMVELINTMNSIHNKEWLRHKTPFVPKRTIRKIKVLNTPEILKQFNTGYTNISYSTEPDSELANEYWLKQQISDYNYDTKEFSFDIYRFKYIRDNKVKCIYRKPQPIPPLPPYIYKFDLDETVDLIDPRLNLGGNWKYYEENVLRKFLRNTLKTEHNVDYYDVSKEVIELDFKYEPYEPNTFDTDKILYLDAYYSWKGHTEEVEQPSIDANGNSILIKVKVPKFEHVEDGITLTEEGYNLYKSHKNNNRTYVEYKDNNSSRGIMMFEYLPKEIEQQGDIHSEYFSAVLPLKGDSTGSWNGIPSDDKGQKYWRMALEQAGYKDRYTKKIPKNRRTKDSNGNYKPIKSMYDQLQETEGVTHCAITQFIDLRWFYRNKLRKNKHWQFYLKRIWELFRDITQKDTKYGKLGSNYSISVWDSSFGLQLIKREIKDTLCSHRCLIGKEIETGDIYLYLNEPIPSEEKLDTFKNFTQYGINLTKYFNGKSFNVANIVQQFPEQVKVDLFGPYEKPNGNQQDDGDSKHDKENEFKRLTLGQVSSGIDPSLSMYVWNEITKTKKIHLDDTNPQDYNARYKDLVHKHKGKKIVYVPYPYIITPQARYNTIDEYEKATGKTWAYTGISAGRAEEDIHTIEVYDSDVHHGALLGTITYRVSKEVTDKFNKEAGTELDTIPAILNQQSLMNHLFHMPRKFWLKLPFRVQTEIYAGTMYIMYRYEYTVKKSTFLGKIFGAILIIIGIVITYITWGSGSTIGYAFIGAGLSYYGAMYNIPALKLLGFAVSAYAAWANIGSTAVAEGASQGGAASAASAAASGTSVATTTTSLAAYANTALTVANTAVSVYGMYHDYKMQKILQREASFTQDYIEQTNQEASTLKNEMLGNYMDLTVYNVEDPYDDYDQFFYITFGGYDFDRIANGLIYNELQQPLYNGELYERFR